MSEELVDEEIVKMEEEPEEKRLRRIIKRIKEDAEQRANEIIEAAEQRANEIIEEARRKAQTNAEKIIRKGKETAEQMKRRKIAEVRLRAKQRKMRVQEEVIENTFQRAREALKNLTTTENYKNVLEKLVLRSAIGLGGGDLEVVLPKQHKGLELNLANIEKKVEEQTGNKTKIKIANDEVEATGGCVVRKSDKSVFIDNTFEATLERKMGKIRAKAAKLLLQ